MYFCTKSYLKTTRNHTVKHARADMHRGLKFSIIHFNPLILYIFSDVYLHFLEAL